jgi:nucleotide-binding universal stress UspA family protein
VTVATEVLLGNPGHKLASAARGADLLVVGSHGHGRLLHAVLGSISEACIRHAPCPVVVTPQPGPQTPSHGDLVETGQ